MISAVVAQLWSIRLQIEGTPVRTKMSLVSRFPLNFKIELIIGFYPILEKKKETATYGKRGADILGCSSVVEHSTADREVPC